MKATLSVLLFLLICSPQIIALGKNNFDFYLIDHQTYSSTIQSDSCVQMALKGRLILEDNFKTLEKYTKEFQPLHDGWRARAWHANWNFTNDGIESDWVSGHNPVLAYEGLFQNVVIELDIKFSKAQEPSDNAYVRINPTNLQLDPRAYSVSTWINMNSRARPQGLILEHEEWKTQGYTSVATEITTFEPEKWYTMRVEILDDNVMVSCNGKSVYGAYKKFGLPKTLLTIGVGKSKHELRKLRVYEATLNPAWTKPGSKPYIPVETLPKRAPLKNETIVKISTLTPIFDGKTLNGWIQTPIAPITIAREDVVDISSFSKRLNEKSDPISSFLYDQLDSIGLKGLKAALDGNKEPRQTISLMLRSINNALKIGTVLYTKERFKNVTLRQKTKYLLEKNPQGIELARLNRLLLEDVYDKEITKSPDVAWVVKDGVLASTGAGRGVIYTEQDYLNYRLVFQVRQSSGNHYPGVLLFCDRPKQDELGLDALGGIQFAVPSGGHWDYRPGVNRSGDHFLRPLKIGFNTKEWAQVEILVNGEKGTAKMVVAQPVGTRPIDVLSFNDPALAGKSGPIALQMHNALLFDEYKDIRIELNPKDDLLITLD